MSRPTALYIDSKALVNNVLAVKKFAPNKKIVAMVKANAYGCGLSTVVSVLEPYVDAFGVACLEEATLLRKHCPLSDCVLFQGIMSQDECPLLAELNLTCVIHQATQLEWILSNPMPKPIKIWLKFDTGMHRLGFFTHEVAKVLDALVNCPWVDKNIVLLSHLACADEAGHISNQQQLDKFNSIVKNYPEYSLSFANSAAIIGLPATHADIVRPGLMLYGISPFKNQMAREYGLLPVMRFESKIIAIHHYPANEPIGYGGTWQSDKPSVIGVIPVGYGDGYPRHIEANTPVYVKGYTVPIVGRVSMDMITIDLTQCSEHVALGDVVELWGQHIPVETIAKKAGTIPYELICQVSRRVIRK